MIRIKLEDNYQCHCGGFVLYVDGKKSHIGYFVTVQALRQFWFKNRATIYLGQSVTY